MSIQFNNYFNKTIQWSDAEAEDKLTAISLARKNSTLIHTDLSITQNSFFSQVIWNIFSIIPCIRNWIFDTNLEYSVEVLQQLKPQIEGRDARLITIFNQAVNNVAEFASSLTRQVKEQLLINEGSSFTETHVALFTPTATLAPQNLSKPEKLEEEDSSFQLFQEEDSSLTASTAKACIKQWQINSTKLSFVEKSSDISQRTGSLVSFENGHKFSCVSDDADKTVKIFLKQNNSNYISQLATAMNKALKESRSLGSKKVTVQLPSRNVSRVKIEQASTTIASTIKSYIGENPSDFDEITLVASSKKDSESALYSEHLNRVFA